MKSLITLSLLFALSGLFVRCTVEKRLYNRGFHVEWNRKVHSNHETVNPEKKNDPEQNQFATNTFTKSDSVIQSEEEEKLAGNLIEPFSIPPKIRKSVPKTIAYVTSDNYEFSSGNLKKKEVDENREPVNRKALIFAISFALVVIGLTILAIILAPALSAEMITLALIILGFGTGIFVDKVLHKRSKSEENSKENPETEEEQPSASDDSPKLSDPDRKLTHKKSNAIALTIIGFLTLGLGFLALFSASTAVEVGSVILLFLGAFTLGIAALIILLISVAVWDDYNDSKKEAETFGSEPDTTPTHKVKGSGWIILGILGLSVLAVLFDHFRTN